MKISSLLRAFLVERTKRVGFTYGLRAVRVFRVEFFTEFESGFGWALTTFASFIKLFICLFKVSGSGMPGVGVVPFSSGVLPILLGSGIPGVGFVPLGVLFAPIVFGSGIPGVEFAVKGTGLVDNPEGIFIGASLLDVLKAFTFESFD